MSRSQWETRKETLLNLMCSRRGPALQSLANEYADLMKLEPKA